MQFPNEKKTVINAMNVKFKWYLPYPLALVSSNTEYYGPKLPGVTGISAKKLDLWMINLLQKSITAVGNPQENP